MAETEAAKDDPGPIGEPAPEEAYGGQWIEVDDCCEAAKDISPRGEAWIKIRGDGRAMTITLVLTHPCGIASYKARVTLWDKTTVSKTSFGKSKNYTLEDTFDCAKYELDPGEGGENKSLSKHLDFHWGFNGRAVPFNLIGALVMVEGHVSSCCGTSADIKPRKFGLF